MLPEQRIIVALDVENKEKAVSLVKELEQAEIFKIGFKLFVSEGVSIIKDIYKFNKKIFLDLKFHDIPNTVAGAIKHAINHNIFMLTLHSLGGREMLKRAVEAAKEEAERLSIPKPKLLAVTILTSLKETDLNELGVFCKTDEQVLRLANLAYEAGVDGIVCSPKEIALLRKNLEKDVLIVTPGIRPAWARTHDQKRVMTPRQAIQEGADYLVIGRPIIASSNPKEAFLKIVNEIKSA